MSEKLTGMYLGKVLKHLSHGCLKVYIPGIYPAELSAYPDQLPTCMQIVPQFAGNNNGNGIFSYPNLSSTVVCFFANGDQNMPITFGSIQGGYDAIYQYSIIDDSLIDVLRRSEEENISTLTQTVGNDLANGIIDISAISQQHRIKSGRNIITYDENGIISTEIEYPNTGLIFLSDNQLLQEDIPLCSVAKHIMMNLSDHETPPLLCACTENYFTQTSCAWFQTAGQNAQISSVAKNEKMQTSCFWYELAEDEGTICALVENEKTNTKSTYIQDTTGNVNLKTENPSVTCFIDMTTDGVIKLNINDVPATIKMDKDGNILIDSSATIKMSSPDITITGSSSITMTAPTINIDGGGGDVVIAGTSLENHTHPYVIHSGVTQPPSP